MHKSLTYSQVGQKRRTRGRKTMSLQHERPPEGPPETDMHAPVGGFGFQKLIIITLFFLEVIMNMY